MNTQTRPPLSRLAAVAFPLVALIAGCRAGGTPELPSGPAAAVAPAPDPDTNAGSVPVPETGPGSLSTPDAPGASGAAAPDISAVDLAQVDADLTEFDSQLSEADRDLATPEGDF